MQKIAIYGAGGFGREVFPMLRNQMPSNVDFAFVDDKEEILGQTINQIPVISTDQAIAEGRYFAIAIANPQTRRTIVTNLNKKNAKFFQATAKNVVIYDEVEIGEGAILCANVVITSNIKIGRQFHANINCYISHDCVFGDFVTMAPNVSCGGNMLVGNDVYIGAGVVFKQGIKGKPMIVGDGAFIGMGAVVIKNVAAGETVVGNPAHRIERQA